MDFADEDFRTLQEVSTEGMALPAGEDDLSVNPWEPIRCAEVPVQEATSPHGLVAIALPATP